MSQLIFGITGNLGTGKSSLAQKLQNYLKKHYRKLKIIEIDDVRRYALWQSEEIHHVQMRKDLAQSFNLPTNSEFHWLDRSTFTNLIFSSKDNLNQYSSIATPFLKYDVKLEIEKSQSPVALVWSLLLEENYHELLTSSVVVISCSNETALERLEPSIKSGNDLSYDELKERMELQSDTKTRLAIATEKKVNCVLYSNEQEFNEKNLEKVFYFLIDKHTFPREISDRNNQYDPTLGFCKFKIPTNSGRVIWEITNECNYGCKYCIFASTGRKPEGELTKKQIFSALEQLKNMGFRHIKFTGGEPFLREDMLEILVKTNNLGFQFDISTNASKIDEETARTLAQLNAEYIHVSLDGYDLASHESVRGKKSFLPTLNGLKLLCSEELKVRVGCVIHSENENNLGDVVRFCSSIGVRHIVFSMMEPVGRLRDKTKGLATKSASQLANSVDELKKQYPYMLISHNLQSMQKISVESIKKSNTASQLVSSCPAGDRFIFINSLGVVSPCTWVSEHRPEYVGGKINKDSLENILYYSPIREMRKIAQSLALSGKAVCPMADLSATSSVELALKASDLNNHNEKFGQFAPIYRFTTENIKYLSMMDIENKKVLTVGGSYDHAIDLALLNAKYVENIDINLCAKYYAQLKRVALLHLGYKKFLSFFGKSNNALNINVYYQLKKHLPLECLTFFDSLYERYQDENATNEIHLANSVYFHNRNNQKFLNHSQYLSDNANYSKAKEKIKSHDFIWYQQSILNHDNIGKFDIILLSNIADYSHKMFEGSNHAEQFKEKVVLPWLSHLEPGGKMMFAYVFDSQNVMGSDKRNCFNNTDVRQNLYGNLENYSFKELTINSTIKKALTDNICILERK